MEINFGRRMNNLTNHVIFCLILILLFLSDHLLASAKVTDPAECAKIQSSLSRLACFDTFFKTPLYLSSDRKPTALWIDYQPEILKIARRVENNRPPETAGLLTQRSIDHEASDQERIILSAPAIGAYPPRPLLIISCINDITRFQIGFEQPLTEHSATVTLNLDDMSIGGDYRWRIIEAKKIVDAGRGIPSINILKRVSKYQRLMIQSDVHSLDGLTFDISGLSQVLPKFRKACHW